MNPTIIAAALGALATIIATVLANKGTREKVTQELEKQNAVQNTEISHIKDTMQEMKADIKSHNNYAKMFNENIPAMRVEIRELNRRMDDLSKKG